MENSSLKVLAINSLPANGNAGLKMVLGVLGTYVIPVPTLLLSGIGSIPGHERYAVPFEALLKGSLALAKRSGQSLIVYVGYLGNAQQAGVILENLDGFRDIIRFVVVDPVCGDNGRAYVPEELIASWHPLLLRADLALPNLTEVALLSGARGALALTQPEEYLSAFRQKYPALECIVTGVTEGNRVSNQWFRADHRQVFAHPHHPSYFSGAGDTYASLLLFFFFFKGLPKEQAILKAGLAVEMLIRYSVHLGSPDLLIHSEFRENLNALADA
ncbi:MAG: bifunctional hydroxymethylpyrimidine kinase/phosphomethylpyrimidine kinase [Ferruginibacter sp.]|nr:bifunctional hydroxymethylpyrimidine kinase/phosphomethylpyrimidine kinase [Cytophagales bacterium]